MDCAKESPEDLFARVASGDRPALDRLVEDWKDPAYRVARCLCKSPALAEEAVQDAFIQLLARKAQFHNRGPGSFRSWFLTLLTNSARMAQRSEHRAKNKGTVNPRDYLTRRRSERRKDAPEGVELKEALECALDTIEERWRTPVVLHFVEGLRQKDIAPLLGVSQQIISLRIERGLKLLRERLAHMGLMSVCLSSLDQVLSGSAPYGPPAAWGAGLAEASSAAAAHPPSARSATRPASWGLKAAACVLAPGLALGLALAWWDSPATRPSAPQQAVPDGASTAPIRNWNFNSGLPKDLIRDSGEWVWNPKSTINGSGALQAPKNQELRIRLPDNLPHEIVVRMRLILGSDPYGEHIGFFQPWSGKAQAHYYDRLFQAIEHLDEKGPHYLEVLADNRNGSSYVALDGEPFMVRERLEVENPSEGHSLGIILSGVELDDLSVHSPTASDRQKWARWLKDRETYSVFKDFEQPVFRNLHGWSMRYSGPVVHAPGKGLAGSTGMECQGSPSNPVVFAVPAAHGKGRQLLRFSWYPLDSFAVQRSALQVLSGYLELPDPEAQIKAAQKLLNRPPPALLDPNAAINRDVSSLPALNCWHEVAFASGCDGSYAVVDGKLFSVWKDPRKLENVTFNLLRIEGHGILDNFSLTVTSESETEQELFQRLTAAPASPRQPLGRP